MLLENTQKLTCVLCNKQIPAEAHIHHCENDNSVEVVKIFLGDEPPEHLNIKNPKNAFAVRADVSITGKCIICNKNDVSESTNVWKMCSDIDDGHSNFPISDGKCSAYDTGITYAICDDCSKSKKAEELRIEKETRLKAEQSARRLNKYYSSPQYLAECIARQREFELDLRARQCEYCGQMLTLTKQDFIEHQDVCKADNAQN